MEAAIERPKLPHLRIPNRGGLSALLSPKRAVIVLPAVLGGMAVACPDVLTALLVQLICYLGSLFEPFDSVLPEKGLLRSLVTTVQRAKKAYNVKYGLVTIDEQQFFDEEDAPTEEEAASAAEGGDGEEEEQEEEAGAASDQDGGDEEDE